MLLALSDLSSGWSEASEGSSEFAGVFGEAGIIF